MVVDRPSPAVPTAKIAQINHLSLLPQEAVNGAAGGPRYADDFIGVIDAVAAVPHTLLMQTQRAQIEELAVPIQIGMDLAIICVGGAGDVSVVVDGIPFGAAS